MPRDPQKSRPLSDIAQQVAECYAIVHPESPARSKALQWLNRARKATTGERGIKSDEMTAAVKELAARRLLHPATESRRGVSARGPMAVAGTLARFCASAHRRGTARLILQQLDEASHDYRYQQSGIRPVQEWQHLEQHVRLALIENAFEPFANAPLPNHVWEWLTEPQAKPYLQRLPPQHLAQACIVGLGYLIHYLLPFDEFAATSDSLTTGPGNSALQARAAVFQGDFAKARKLIKQTVDDAVARKPELIEAQALSALIATLTGDDDRAMAAIELTLAEDGKGTRKKILYPDTLSFSMALLALVRLGTPKARALFQSLITARDKLKLRSDSDWLLQAAEQADKPETTLNPLYLPGPPSIMSVFYAIGTRWHEDYGYPLDHPPFRHWLEALTRQAVAGGYPWAVAELKTVLEAAVTSTDSLSADIQALFAESTATQDRERIGVQSLTALVPTLEPWEFSLRELEQLALASKPAKPDKSASSSSATRRLVWRLQEYYGGTVLAEPFEQVLGKTGEWSSGRRVALKRLQDATGKLPPLIDQDLKASRTIRKVAAYGWGGGSPTYETDQRTVYQLVGHPHVYDDQGQRVDVVEQPPALQLTERDGALQLSVEPAFSGNHYRAQLDPANRRVNVTHFTAAHRRICAALPEREPLALPSDASDRVQALLRKLTGDIAVHGDAQSAQTTVTQGSSEPVLVLEPSGSALQVRFRVEPLRDSGVYFDAGQGGAVVYVPSEAGTVAVQRGLAAEQSRMQQLVDQSTVLARHFDGRPQLLLDDTLEALELIEEAQAAGIRTLWPGDIPFKIKASANTSQVQLDIKSAKDWFTASGALAFSEEDEETDSISIERLLQLMQSQPGTRFIELGKGEFLSLSRTLQQQLNTLQAFALPTRGEATAPRIHPLAALALDPLIETATIKADSNWQKLRQRVTQTFNETPAVPAALQAELRSYQQQGFAWLARLGNLGAGACLADDMGLGKTVQALALLLQRADGGPALVVAPTSVMGNWVQEAQRFAPSLTVAAYTDQGGQRQQMLKDLGAFDVVVISYGLLVNDIEHLERVHWHSVILDEAQAIKNANTHRARSARALKADFRMITTGTPVQNNLMDLHSLFAFLNPQLLGSEGAFRKRYALPITRDNDEHARKQLQLLVSPFLLRRLKRDVLQELPARTELKLDVNLSKEEALLYETLRNEALETLDQNGQAGGSKDNNQHRFTILTYLTKLRRLCCNPKLVAPDWNGPTSKLKVFAETLAELIAGGHKALVFSQFVDHLKIVEQHLIDSSISYQYIDGSVSAKQRTTRVSAFQGGDGDVFLISLTAGGTGLNLTAADYVIHLDPWWNPAVEDQASDRAHRLGQQRPVTIIRMVTAGTIEEQIQHLHSNKRDLADSVLAGADSPALTADAMLQLLRGTTS